MIGYHVVWDPPRTSKWESWEVLLQVLSAVMWKEGFGPIKLLCDAKTLEYFKSIGVDELYDEIDVFDNSMLKGIDPDIYFAAAKLLGMLQVQDDQCAFIDTDLLLTPPKTPIDETNVYVFHREYPIESVYPDLWDRWKSPIPTDSETHAMNCALVYWPNRELRRNYASMALKFMRTNDYHGMYDKNVLMVNAEQRMLGFYLKHRGIIPDYYIKDIYIPDPDHVSLSWIEDGLGSNLKNLKKEFLHLWGHKKELRNNKIEAAQYTFRLYELCVKYDELKIDNILKKLKI